MPHSQKSNYIINSPWDSVNKQSARWITIINLYKELFQRAHIPENQQYWSLCGAHTKENKPIKGELGHLLEYKLIQKNQYYGIDREHIIIKNNKKYFPDINWVHGDFVETIENAISNGSFNPAIVNYDGVMQPDNSTQYLKKIMTLIDHNIDNELMLISNFVLWNPYRSLITLRYDVSSVLQKLKNIYWIPNHWSLYPETYLYTNSQAKMGVFIFIKKEHEINNIQYTQNRVIGLS